MKKPILTHVHKACRVSFAVKYLQWDEADWIDMAWSDEATFTVTESRGANIYWWHDSDPLNPCFICVAL
ncbi:hypothetical protein E2C01_080595 [Portunus trituberculatus]|uniref:Uncharacterized protein n=1 Tax=Portunus trituberculatus TaxID=210409 RepID=A0A5B7IUG8_PORTR|nr:hypothetical protein [Portunus trituberculatus]